MKFPRTASAVRVFLSLGRLIREDNAAHAKTCRFVYDRNGNILRRFDYPLTTAKTSDLLLQGSPFYTYSYAENSDRLLSYNGDIFVYNAIGNPTTYRSKTMTWESGGFLASYNGVTFTYDARGRRIGKNGMKEHNKINVRIDKNEMLGNFAGISFLFF